MAASPIKLGPRGDLPRPGSSGVQLPSLDGQEQQVGRKFAPPAGVPRPPFNTAYPPPRPDFDAMDDDADPPPSGGGVASNPRGLDPEPEQLVELVPGVAGSALVLFTSGVHMASLSKSGWSRARSVSRAR